MVQADLLALNAAGAPKVCIVDSGYDIGHEDLQKTAVDGINLTRAGAWNTDENSHGTHVAGTVAALGNNGVGVVGVVGSGNLPLHIAKVFDASGSARSSLIVKAVQACADAGSRVISMSLGGGGATRFEQRLYDGMQARGILVVAAAGNDGTSAVSYPAGYQSVMSVAAVDAAAAWADFSQFNADVEIAGPGVAVTSTVPVGSQLGSSVSVGALAYPSQPMDGSALLSATGPLADFGLGSAAVRGSMTGKVCLISRGSISFADKVQNCQSSGGVGAIIYNNAEGELFGTLAGARTAIPSVGITQADGQALLELVGQLATVSVGGTADVYAAYSGTSMATPHVSAVAALVWSHFPQCTAAQVRAALTATARDIDAPGPDERTGAGLVQAKAAYDRLAQNCGS
jgi:subtilisin family serine protease